MNAVIETALRLRWIVVLLTLGILGLGYWAKYHLDKRVVFRTAQVAP